MPEGLIDFDLFDAQEERLGLTECVCDLDKRREQDQRNWAKSGNAQRGGEKQVIDDIHNWKIASITLENAILLA